MGFKYTEVRAGRPPQGAPPKKDTAAKKAAPAERPALTVEAVKRTAGQYNKYGAIAKKFGMKILVHNHAVEFERLQDSDRTQYDVLLAETDPALVAMQMDIGWVFVAGQDPFRLFREHPGRFELWHVKDQVGLKTIDPALPTGRRRATFVPIGQGEVDYRPIFDQAKLAGLKHYVIEQDNAAQNGADSMAAARANFQGLMKVLS
jgi:sugar phosphate isomerase/epimerase